MTIHSLYLIAGFSIDWKTLYKHCLSNSQEFQNIIKKDYLSHVEDFTFDEFFLFVEGLDPQAKFSEESSKLEAMRDVMLDSCSELGDMKYPINKDKNADLSMFKVTHDIDENGSFVVGILLATIQLGKQSVNSSSKLLCSLFMISNRLSDAFNKMVSLGFSLDKIDAHIVQDNCVCCS